MANTTEKVQRPFVVVGFGEAENSLHVWREILRYACERNAAAGPGGDPEWREVAVVAKAGIARLEYRG